MKDYNYNNKFTYCKLADDGKFYNLYKMAAF